MTRMVIQANDLGKEYRRGLGSPSGLLRDALAKAMRSPASLLRRESAEKFWALRNVSLEVQEGEVLGLIGRNGSGKTTLLKILSRITQPTMGWAEIHGRVGSLLEVGTGFHPELTGRENTYLSGAILGMGKQEITRKFDEIVAFAELEEFVDTPVKHYSSGMYVRLAFAVAAHLEPEILLVDEVLAVGDIKFQKKCLGKMGDVARAGRTIILVSHQLNQIRRLCHRVAWVDSGSLRQLGRTHEVVGSYESAMTSPELADSVRKESSSLRARFTRWEIVSSSAGDWQHTLTSHSPVKIRFHLDVRKPIRNSQQGIAIFNADRQLIWATATQDISFDPGVHHLDYDFPSLPLRPGAYSWQVSIWEHEDQIELWDAVPDLIIAAPNYQHWRDEWNGVLNIPSSLSISLTKGKPFENGLGL
jgi:lipopolysaccharide transport system ATP-binding protein